MDGDYNMCANFNSNLLKRNKKCYEKKCKKRHIQNLWKIIKITFPAIAYSIVFVLESFIDNSVGFSLVLALFSTCVTVAFEINEWQRLKRKKLSYNYSYPLLLALILLIALVFIYNGIETSIGISKSIPNKVPNVISSLTLLIYFISYTVRQLKCEG